MTLAYHPVEAPAERGEEREGKDGEEAMTHTAPIESCIANLGLLMRSRNHPDDGKNRRARIRAKRNKFTEKLRTKA